MPKKSHRKLRKFSLALIAAIIIVIVLWLTNVIHTFHNTAVVRPPSAPIKLLKTSSNSINPATNSGTKVPSNSPTTFTQGTDTDNSGQIPSSVSNDSSSWSTSSSGVITVETPIQNSTFESGGTVAGTASVKQVQYTLIDNQSGVISQGFINVINNKFSASINFNSQSNSGRLDVFSTDADGREVNEVQLNVNF
jgi:hypothetical protein